VAELSDLECFCSTTHLGSPPGRLRVYHDATVVKVGEYGVSNTSFTIRNVQRNNTNDVLTCQLLWMPNDVMVGNITYTISVSCKLLSFTCISILA
jgi:hypothetical protein